jgi:ABC-type transporter Mla maintaining outer membrane lipid asymmetry permease subunit MlaE
LRHIYRFASLIAKTASRCHLLFKNPDLTIAQMYGLGIESTLLVSVIALFLGLETVVQAVYQMSDIIPMRYLGVLEEQMAPRRGFGNKGSEPVDVPQKTGT